MVMVVGGSAQGDGERHQEEYQGQQQAPAGDGPTAVERPEFSCEVEEYKSPGGEGE